MNAMKARLVACAVAAATSVVLVPAGPAQAHDEPTCADVTLPSGGIVVHGHHIVRDYVVGASLQWPPAGAVGQAVGGEGPAIPGGPGIKKHPAAPGASFCNPQSQSPGFHVPG